MSVKEVKEVLHLSGADTLNVFFASNSVREELAGAATWPWAKDALTHQGEWSYIKLRYSCHNLTAPFIYLFFAFVNITTVFCPPFTVVLFLISPFLFLCIFLLLPILLNFTFFALFIVGFVCIQSRGREQLKLADIYPAHCLFPLPIISPVSTGKD